MRGYRFSIRSIELAVCGSLLFLAGCPSAGDGDQSVVATMVVEGIESSTGECHLPANAEEAIDRLLDLTNQERVSRGLPAVVLNPVLSRLADDYSCQMIEEGFFSHIDPFTEDGPGQRAISGGYVFLAIGENLGGGQSSPEQVMNEWMTSDQGHRENVLGAQWSEVGLSVRTGGQYGVYWVQVFGNPP